VTIPNSDSLSYSETKGYDFGITYLIELDVRKPLVVSFSQRSEAGS
jgi:hypothetical protein